MPTYVTLWKWTDQGLKNVKGTVERAHRARRTVEQAGGRILALYWTEGAYDGLVIEEFPDEDAAMAFLLATGMQGNVRTETMKAFGEEDMQRILGRLP